MLIGVWHGTIIVIRPEHYAVVQPKEKRILRTCLRVVIIEDLMADCPATSLPLMN